MLYSVELRGLKKISFSLELNLERSIFEWAAKIRIVCFAPKLTACYFYKMKIQFWSIGKNHEKYVKEGIGDFTNRISKYFPVEWNIIPVPKNAGMMSEMDLKKKEGETILEWLKKDDYLVVLDERGRSLTSEGLAEFIQQRGNESVRTLI